MAEVIYFPRCQYWLKQLVKQSLTKTNTPDEFVSYIENVVWMDVSNRDNSKKQLAMYNITITGEGNFRMLGVYEDVLVAVIFQK